MLFYKLNFTNITDRLEITVPYRHITVVNRSNNVCYINYNNNGSFAEIQALESFTFLDVISKNIKDIVSSSSSKNLKLVVSVSNVPSEIHIYNYGV